MIGALARRAGSFAQRLAAPACAGALCLSVACDAPWNADPAKRDDTTLAARSTRLVQSLAHPPAGAAADSAVARWLLPKELREISGLALTADGRLFVEADQAATIWELDYRRGVIRKRFSLGDDKVKGDFESIAIADDRFFLLTSKGLLYEFAEGGDSAHMDYSTLDTGLGAACELEGMAYEASTASLLIACKRVYEKALKDSLAIFRWKLDGETARGMALPRVTIPVAAVIAGRDWKHVRPSDITVDPVSGHYVLIASNVNAIIEISQTGALISVRPIPGKHDQPEGVAITKDGLLLISDEGPYGPAVLTLYRRK